MRKGPFPSALPWSNPNLFRLEEEEEEEETSKEFWELLTEARNTACKEVHFDVAAASACQKKPRKQSSTRRAPRLAMVANKHNILCSTLTHLRNVVEM